MAWRMTKRSCLSAASFDRVTDFMYRPEPRLSRIRIMVTTIIISSSVKPARASARRETWGELLRGFRGRRGGCRIVHPLPVGIVRTVQCRAGRTRVHIENVFAAPTGRVGIILNGAESPVVVAGHRVA